MMDSHSLILANPLRNIKISSPPLMRKNGQLEYVYHKQLAEYYMANNNFDAALAAAKNFVMSTIRYKDTNFFTYGYATIAYRYCGAIQLKLGNFDEAIEMYQEAIKIHQENNLDTTTEKIDLAISYLFMGKLDEGLSELNQLLPQVSLCSTPGLEEINVRSLRGVCYVLQGKAELASQEFEYAYQGAKTFVHISPKERLIHAYNCLYMRHLNLSPTTQDINEQELKDLAKQFSIPADSLTSKPCRMGCP